MNVPKPYILPCILLGMALTALLPLVSLAQRSEERTPEQLQVFEERQAQLGSVSEDASRQVERERARRQAPFDLLWGAR